MHPNQGCILSSRNGATLLKLSRHLCGKSKKRIFLLREKNEKMPEGFILVYEFPSRQAKYYKVVY